MGCTIIKKKMISNLAALASATMAVSMLLSTSAVAEEPTPGFKPKISEWVQTPDTVETKVGNLAIAEQELNTI